MQLRDLWPGPGQLDRWFMSCTVLTQSGHCRRSRSARYECQKIRSQRDLPHTNSRKVRVRVQFPVSVCGAPDVGQQELVTAFDGQRLSEQVRWRVTMTTVDKIWVATLTKNEDAAGTDVGALNLTIDINGEDVADIDFGFMSGSGPLSGGLGPDSGW